MKVISAARELILEKSKNITIPKCLPHDYPQTLTPFQNANKKLSKPRFSLFVIKGSRNQFVTILFRNILLINSDAMSVSFTSYT